MTIIPVQLDPQLKQLRFEEFPTHSIEYLEDAPSNSSYACLQIADTKTKKIFSVFFKKSDLHGIGISRGISSRILQNAFLIEKLIERAIPIISEHLSYCYLKFFKDIPQANRIIIHMIEEDTRRLSHLRGVPGIYFSSNGTTPGHLFINLKGTGSLGAGGFGKIRKVLWLTAPRGRSPIIAKKVIKNCTSEKAVQHFVRELAALKMFSRKNGIISMISGGRYKGKYAIFMPIYDFSLLGYLNSSFFRLELNEKLDLISEWLEGLVTISEKGIHGDLSPSNLLIKKDQDNKIKGVIADFGAFCLYGEEKEYELTRIYYAPPEYYEKKAFTSKQDVWALGLSFHEMFSKKLSPWWKHCRIEEMIQWASKLTPGWCLENFVKTTPPFLKNLISDMLDPRPDHRLSAKDAFECFLEGHASFPESK